MSPIPSVNAQTDLAAVAAETDKTATEFAEPGARANDTVSGRAAASIGLLGKFRLHVAGQVATKLPVKAQALLAYIASEIGQPVSRDRLADLAWPRSGPEQARQSLRQALLAIRQALAPASNCELVSTGPDSVKLTGVDVDLEAFQQVAGSDALGDLERAAELYRGIFLDGLPPISQVFDQWRTIEQARLANLASRVLVRLAEAYLASGRLEDALVTAQKLVALDRLREDAHRLLIRCYGAAGRRSEALRQYETCTAILRRELNVPPDAETTALAERIRGKRPPQPKQELAEAEGEPIDADPEHGAIEVPETAVVRTNKGNKHWIIIAAGVIVLMTLAAKFWPAPDARLSFQIAAFTALTPDASSEALVRALTSRLIVGIGGIPTVRLSTSGQTEGAAAPPTDYRIDGSVATGSQTTHVEARVTEIKSGQVVYTTQFDAPQREPVEMQDEILGDIGDDLTVEINKLSYPHPLDTIEKQKGLELAREASSRVDRAEDPNLILEQFQRAVVLDPANVEILAWYANALIGITSNDGYMADPQSKYLQQARSLLDQGEKLAPFHRLISYGRCQYSTIVGEAQAALVACQSTNRIIPWRARVYKNMGMSFLLLGLFDEALKAFQTADKLQKVGSVRWTWYWGAGLTCLLTNRNSEAVDWLLKASLLRTTDPWNHAMLAVAYRRLNEVDNAEHQRDEFIKLNPPTSVSDFIDNSFPPRIDYNTRLRDAIERLRAETAFAVSSRQ